MSNGVLRAVVLMRMLVGALLAIKALRPGGVRVRASSSSAAAAAALKRDVLLLPLHCVLHLLLGHHVRAVQEISKHNK